MFKKILVLSVMTFYAIQGATPDSTAEDRKNGTGVEGINIQVTSNSSTSMRTIVKDGNRVKIKSRAATRRTKADKRDASLESLYKASPERAEQDYQRCLQDNFNGKMLLFQANNPEGTTIEFPKKCRQAQVYCALVSAQKEMEIYLEFLKEKHPEVAFEAEDIKDRYNDMANGDDSINQMPQSLSVVNININGKQVVSFCEKN